MAFEKIAEIARVEQQEKQLLVVPQMKTLAYQAAIDMVEALVDEGGVAKQNVTIDLQEVHIIDSMAMGQFIILKEKMAGRVLSLTNVNSTIRKVLSMSQLDQVLRVVD